MTDTQVTLVQIDNYGPWTVTPEPRREVDLQALQADLYADVVREFGAQDGYVFFARFDNVVAVTNGIDRAAHERLQASVGNRYPVSVSLAAARAETPADALGAATASLQSAGGAQEASRREALRWHADGTADGEVRLAHFDVIDATGRYTDREDAYTSLLRIERAGLALMERLYERDALAFFVGGDNFIAVCPALDRAAYDRVVREVREATGVELRVGVGRGATAGEAGMAAKVALEECRERGATVAGDLAPTPDQ